MTDPAGSDPVRPRMPSTETFFLDDFAKRQWEAGHAGTRIEFDPQGFVEAVERAYQEGGRELSPGYAPFCKHVFVPNFCGALRGAQPITDENRGLVRSGYVARRPEELPVLSRWFDAGDVERRPAKFLDIILYSREQCVEEYKAMPPRGEGAVDWDAVLPRSPWGIISIKGQDEDHETPMQPITILRNALGREQGGSGVPVDDAEYRKAAEYWDAHAIIQ